MYELYPYFTNDGTVGLFSREDDDIYHSTYGALTESWQKFILPSRLEEYIQCHESVKILDICYGIGYNTKTALNVFIKNVLKNKNEDKIFAKNETKNDANFSATGSSSAAIYADNILKKENKNFGKKYTNNLQNAYDNQYSIAEIDTDNEIAENSHENNRNCIEKCCNEILIDAVDLDKTLLSLSPFIKLNPKYCCFLNKKNQTSLQSQNKLLQIEKIKGKKTKRIKNEFKLRKEIPILIFLKLLENHFNIFDNQILQTILSHKKYAPFLSRFMIDFSKFYQKFGYKYNKTANNSTFLHNIYYQYISKSYKNVKSLIKNSKIDLNFFQNDARRFIQETTNTYNFIFLDAFTPSKCPALWTVQFFRKLYSKLDDDGMILTYSSSAAIRNAFLKNGFYLGKIYDDDLKKFVGTVAVKNKNLIEHDLSEKDIDLINSKAGICFEDEHLNLDNKMIIQNRNAEVMQSDLLPSSRILKGHADAQ